MPHRILLVDDDPVNLRIMKNMVERMGHLVEAFDDPRKAWERCQEAAFSIMVLDWMMPSLDGLELCRRIRSTPQGAQAIILIATVRDSESDVSEALEAGANDYLRKPIDESLLRIRFHIHLKNVSRSAA